MNVTRIGRGAWPRGSGPGWRKAKLRAMRWDDTPVPHMLPLEPAEIQYVAFKLTYEAEREAIDSGLNLSVVELVDSRGLWFSDDDEPPFMFWLHLVPWSQVLAFGARPWT